MSQYFSLLIAWGCAALLLFVPAGILYFAFNLDSLESLARISLKLPLQWHTITSAQWYMTILATALYLGIGLAGLCFLRRAFGNFAKGELFNGSNSRDFRSFSILLFVQAVVQPLHLATLSVILSWNHPPGQKLLSLAIGTNELRVIALGMVLWVMSDVLVAGSRLRTENQQFV